MADSSERKRSLKLSIFGSEPTTVRSPRCFGHGAVGLGIVAAMSKAVGDGTVAAPAPALALALLRSDPIPIVPARPAARDEDDDGDLLERHTYVISHVRGDHVRRVYFDDGVNGNNPRSSGVFFESLLPSPSAPSPVPPRASEFLSRCHLCQKELHGLDVFIYRGEKAFCSVECRCQQILSDEHREKCGSEESPWPASLLFVPRVAAA